MLTRMEKEKNRCRGIRNKISPGVDRECDDVGMRSLVAFLIPKVGSVNERHKTEPCIRLQITSISQREGIDEFRRKSCVERTLLKWYDFHSVGTHIKRRAPLVYAEGDFYGKTKTVGEEQCLSY